VIVMLRKLLFVTCLSITHPYGLKFQVLIGLSVLIIAMGFQIRCMPYDDVFVDQAEVVSLGVSIMTLFLGFLLFLKAEIGGSEAVSVLIVALNVCYVPVMLWLAWVVAIKLWGESITRLRRSYCCRVCGGKSPQKVEVVAVTIEDQIGRASVCPDPMGVSHGEEVQMTEMARGAKQCFRVGDRVLLDGKAYILLSPPEDDSADGEGMVLIAEESRPDKRRKVMYDQLKTPANNTGLASYGQGRSQELISDTDVSTAVQQEANPIVQVIKL